MGLALLAISATPAASYAEEGGSVRWEPSFRRATVYDGAVAAAGGLLYVGDLYLGPRRDKAIWHGPILWDSALRDALRLHVRGQRDNAAQVSDILFAGSLVHNLIFDNLVVAWLVHDAPDVAFQMSMMDLEAYAVAGAVTGLVKTAAGRERPYQDRCATDPGYSDLCGAETSYRAFFSAHAATTAVGAGLLCAHHLHMPLYDGAVLDVGACAVGVALTLVTGALRVASDRHWSTDVTTGHLVGFASGYFIPTLLYYEWGDAADDADGAADARTTAVLPSVGPDGVGVRVVGLL